MSDPNELLNFLATRGVDIIRQTYTARSCIASTRIALRVIRLVEPRLEAWAQAVRLDAMNAPAAIAVRRGEAVTEAELLATGAKIVGVNGTGRITTATNEWDGHLVLVVRDSAGLEIVADLTLDQFSRPEHDLPLAPSVIPVKDGWPMAVTWLSPRRTIVYRKIESRSYRSTLDWGRSSIQNPIAQRIAEEFHNRG